MRINFFKVYIYIQTIINLSVDYISRNKFTRQRLSRIAKLQKKENTERFFYEWVLHHCNGLPKLPDGFEETDINGQSNSKRRSKWRLRQEKREKFGLAKLFKHLELGWINSSVFLFHILCLVYLVIKHSAYTLFPPTYNIGLAKEVRDFLKSISIYDTFATYSKARQFNGIQLLMLLPPLVQRLWTLREMLKVARENEPHYRKLNVVSLNIAYLDTFNLTLTEWAQLFRETLTHKCDIHSILSSNDGDRLRDIHKWTRKLEPIDQLYFTNPLDFDKCYGVNFWYEKDEHTTLTPEDIVKYSSNKQTNFILTRPPRLWQLSQTFKPRKWFLPQPGHRFDVSYVIIFLAVASFTATLFVSMNVLVFWTRLYHQFMVECDPDSLAIGPTYAILTFEVSSEFLWLVFDAIAADALLAISACDYLMLFVSVTIHHSRTMKVVRMLRHEVSMLEINRQRRGTTIETMEVNHNVFKTKPTQNPVDLARVKPYLQTRALTQSSEESETLSSSHWVYSNNNCCENLSLSVITLDEHSKFINHNYRAIFNKNLEYLIDLCLLSIEELRDLKEWFTFYLNISIVVSTFNSAYSIILLMNIDTIVERIVVAQIFVMCLLPLVSALVFGAVMESVSRKLYWAINRVMSIDNRVIEIRHMRRMSKFLSFLGSEASRSFVLLGNVPLTTATIIPVLTSVCTSCLLLDRLLR